MTRDELIDMGYLVPIKKDSNIYIFYENLELGKELEESEKG